ncbi:unnamed protein product [Rotaria sp. Silwood2]|nr:unnamed protein product [Rotaria sp. Silwood2]CAF2973766.1 unnamed protein product [Rotaria sp. Silwood2]CAF3911125.1 unnamed protein product [Rotaria sp. Silwood2]CAF4143802.1 unnamed protein product [Rotaria sp. Silwood2]
MNILHILLPIAILLISKTYSVPIDTTEYLDLPTDEIPIATTITTTTTTTTTTTLAPEVDHEWEDLVLGGPTVVNYLGLFMVHASRKDQVLTPSSDYTINYIHNVQSLRATLIQISSAMQAAFQVAREDLVRIQNSMNQIPEHIKAGLLLIQTAPKDLLSKLLPYTLRNVKRAANEGSSVSKPTLERFVSVGLLLEEFATLISSTSSTSAENADYLIEANAYSVDMKIQWDLVVKLFKKFSERADFTQTSISNSFIEPADQVLNANSFNSQSDRLTLLQKLISATIAIDQSSHLLDMMARTYNDVSNDHMEDQITSNKAYLGLTIESVRATSQRQLWQNLLSQSVKVARLTQERHKQFAETSLSRQAEYATYLEGVLSA